MEHTSGVSWSTIGVGILVAIAIGDFSVDSTERAGWFWIATEESTYQTQTGLGEPGIWEAEIFCCET
jgi:hypothetical protein